MSLEYFKYVLVIIKAALSIIVNTINLYTGSKRGKLFGYIYLAIILYNLFLLHKKVILGIIED